MDILHFREPFSALSHALWLVLSIPATVILVRKSRGERSKQISLLIFGVSLAACYLGSALNHGVQGSVARMDWYNRLDRVGIHFLIAGSYTPLAWNLLQGRWKWGTLAVVWGMNILGSLAILARFQVPFALQTCEYLVLGWGAIFCYFEALRVTSARAMRPLIVGGVFYSVGACLNLLQWPAIFPETIGFHGVVHLWVMAGSVAHVVFMWWAVIPFQGMPLRATTSKGALATVATNPGSSPLTREWAYFRSLSRWWKRHSPHRSAPVALDVLPSVKDRVT